MEDSLIRFLVKKSGSSPIICPDYSYLETEMISKMSEEDRKRYVEEATGFNKLREMFNED